MQTGLVVLLHHQLTLRLGASPQSAHTLHVPVRKRVECRTRDLHQSLVVKLSQAISRAADQQQGLTAAQAVQRLPSLMLVSLVLAECAQQLGASNLVYSHFYMRHPMERWSVRHAAMIMSWQRLLVQVAIKIAGWALHKRERSARLVSWQTALTLAADLVI